MRTPCVRGVAPTTRRGRLPRLVPARPPCRGVLFRGATPQLRELPIDDLAAEPALCPVGRRVAWWTATGGAACRGGAEGPAGFLRVAGGARLVRREPRRSAAADFRVTWAAAQLRYRNSAQRMGARGASQRKRQDSSRHRKGQPHPRAIGRPHETLTVGPRTPAQSLSSGRGYLSLEAIGVPTIT